MTLSCKLLPYRAGNGTRTRDPNLGKVVLYQLSYSRRPARLPGQPEPDRPKTRYTCTTSNKPHRDGGEGNRTPDLLNAIQALSQLSYAPGRNAPARETPCGVRQRGRQEPRSLVGCMAIVKQKVPRRPSGFQLQA